MTPQKPVRTLVAEQRGQSQRSTPYRLKHGLAGCVGWVRRNSPGLQTLEESSLVRHRKGSVVEGCPGPDATYAADHCTSRCLSAHQTDDRIGVNFVSCASRVCRDARKKKDDSGDAQLIAESHKIRADWSLRAARRLYVQPSRASCRCRRAKRCEAVARSSSHSVHTSCVFCLPGAISRLAGPQYH